MCPECGIFRVMSRHSIAFWRSKINNEIILYLEGYLHCKFHLKCSWHFNWEKFP